MKPKCLNCKKPCKIKYCSSSCKTTWHNRNRKLKPNLIYDCNVCGKHVEKWESPQRMAKGIATGEYCSRTCAGVGRSGNGHFNWKGGRQKDKDGYVLIYNPLHPHANKSGYVREHRLKMEKKLGRLLRPDEVVHHKNGITSDNRLANLRLYSANAKHKQRDYKYRKIDKNGRFLPIENKDDSNDSER